ncbi:MAG TPA: hemolysin family protein [Planctomycetota bacterium]|nr:hemolysin family protein [Planctomycetota bacterium]
MENILFNLLTIVLLVFANAFFVAAEFALVRVRRTRIEELIAAGNNTAKVVKTCIDHLDDYISATQVGITLASLALGWRGEAVLADMVFGPLLHSLVGPEMAESSVHYFSVAAAFFVITFMHVVMGELMPKSLALQFPEKMSLWVARPMRLCAIVFRPLIWLLNGSSNLIMRTFGVKPVDAHSLALSEEELLMLLSESKKAGVVTEEEQKMVQRVFKFYDKTVREIMKPRPDIAYLELRANESEIKHAFEQGYSRLPVCAGGLNNVKGIVYVKDLIYTLQDPKLIKLVDLLREALFVPESKPVPALLREFQKSKVHMAIVVDEFGDTAGLVTLEDVIEEIVGEIQDEYDSELAEIERALDGTFVFDGKTGIERFKEIFPAFEMPEGTFETVAGLVFQLAGRVPKEGDTYEQGGLAFKIVKREGRRLRKIAVKRLAAAAVAAKAEAAGATPEAAEKEAEAAAAAAMLAEDGRTPTARYEAIKDEIDPARKSRKDEELPADDQEPSERKTRVKAE